MSEDPLDLRAPIGADQRAALLRRAATLAPVMPPAAREERMWRDPLGFIPAERLAAVAGPAPEPESGPFLLDADDPHFCGQGWWHAERTAAGALRWAGTAPSAALLLPALGGGALRLTLAVRSPYGVPLEIGDYDLLLDGAPLVFATLENDGVVGRFVAETPLPAMPAGARVALLLHGHWHEDPATGPQRDIRRLGLGLISLRLERA